MSRGGRTKLPTCVVRMRLPLDAIVALPRSRLPPLSPYHLRIVSAAFVHTRLSAPVMAGAGSAGKCTQPAQAWLRVPASPESIITSNGYGFRPSPLGRLGRNDEARGLV